MKSRILSVAVLLLLPGAVCLAQEHEGHKGHAENGRTVERVDLDIPDVTVLDHEGKPRHFYTDLVKD
jgi:hypothetical protein